MKTASALFLISLIVSPLALAQDDAKDGSKEDAEALVGARKAADE